MVVPQLLVAAGLAGYWHACAWPTIGSDILLFLIYWVLLPHAALYTLIWLVHPTVWYTERPAAAPTAAAAAAPAAAAGAGIESKKQEVSATAAAAAADEEEAATSLGAREAAAAKIHRAESAASTPSTRAGSAAAVTPSATPPPPLSRRGPAAAASPTATAAAAASPTTAFPAATAAKDQRAPAAAPLQRAEGGEEAAAADALEHTASRQLSLKTRVLSFVITRILCLLLLTCIYINLFCLRHLHKVWHWYVPYACWCLFFAEKYGRSTGFSFQWVRRSRCWKYLGEYFPLVLLKANEKSSFPPDRNYLFGFHPRLVLEFFFGGSCRV